MEDGSEDISPWSEWVRRSSTASRWRLRSISGVDGPTSRLPSSSVASMTTGNLAARQSTNQSYNSAPVSPSTFIDPPRPARDGHEWVWFPAGYWAEREVIESPRKVMKHFKWRKRSGKSSSGKDTQEDLQRSPSNSWAQAPQNSPFLTEEAHVQSLQRPAISRNGTSSGSGGSTFPLNRPLQTPLSSPYLTEEAHVQSLQRSPLVVDCLNCNSGISIPRLTSKPIQSSPLINDKGDSDSATPIVTPLEKSASIATASLSSIFHNSTTSQEGKPKRSFMARILPDHKPKIKKTPDDDDDDDFNYGYMKGKTGGAKTQVISQSQSQSAMRRVVSLLREESKDKKSRGDWPHRIFGKSPWHREAFAGSEASVASSVSSSVRDVLRGRTPFTSPVSDIDRLNSFSAQFPGGEATRIKTPPIRESGHHAGRPRSFFFDISTPPARDGSLGSSAEHSDYYHTPFPTTTTERDEKDRSSPKKERETEREKRDQGDKEWWEVPVAVPQYGAMAPSSFEFNMPEHLPNSPMCPANKRHKSGGTGVCVYHGRRKRSGPHAKSKNRGSDEDADRTVWAEAENR
ncbi:uncharacterized protein GGS22DRAFT_184593 [Annulohypoxylon maeteangense]|uniref:uncharacterized protein n=1 Tax=Annulohypoxylon maeteangense TaxID=1927788 RepID=UPI0020072170|nr:uncharacterized protein GGS22DRAFT_184593 [Annulohypoxylon maeteangense]KAI0889018.1 hypothetical protein GGS22DRAFT_184593 [Annulohypoxylon maeteangense]